MERGLIDADLGSGLFKKRITRSGAGKRDGFIVQRDAAINSGFLTEVICDAQAQVRLD